MKKGLALGIVLIVAGLLLFQNTRGKLGKPISTSPNMAMVAGAVVGVGAFAIFATYYYRHA